MPLAAQGKTDEKTLLDCIDKMIENDQYYQGIKEKELKHNKRKMEVYSMGKTATLNIRVNTDVKENAESVLAQLGIPMATAIDTIEIFAKSTKKNNSVEKKV